jgi:hypothetical protein
VRITGLVLYFSEKGFNQLAQFQWFANCVESMLNSPRATLPRGYAVKLNIATIVLGGLAVSCAMMSGYFLYIEIREVNRKLPEDQQSSYLWMYSEKFSRIKQEYKRLYPQGRIHLWGLVFEIAFFILFILAVADSGFFRPPLLR